MTGVKRYGIQIARGRDYRQQEEITVKMPGLIGVAEFVEETREDYNSPTTSTFVSRMPHCRQTINILDEVGSFLPHSLSNSL